MTKNTDGLLAVVAQQILDGTYKRDYEQRQREIEFDRAVQEQLSANPTHAVLPDNWNDSDE